MVTGQPRPRVTTQLFVSGRPSLTFRMERRRGGAEGVDDAAFSAHFDIRDASPEAVLSTLDDRTRSVLLEHAKGLVTATPEGLSFFVPQQMITGDAARARFEALTDAFLHWMPSLERK